MRRLLLCVLASIAMTTMAFAGLTWEATKGDDPADCKIVWTGGDGATFTVSLRGASIQAPPCFKITGSADESVGLAWDANTETSLAGYKIHFGLESRNYSKTYDVGNVTEYTVTGLSFNTVYYFAATAYDTAGNESDYSNEVTWEAGVSPIEIIIDNRDAGKTSLIGEWPVSNATGYHGVDSVYNKYGGTFTFSQNDLSPGSYGVWLLSPYRDSRCQAVPVWIEHGDGVATVEVNQRTEKVDWVLLGEFPVENQLTVTLFAQEGCSTCADAVKIVVP